MMVDLGPVSLNPEHVVSVQSDTYGNRVLVKDVTGVIHEILPQYGESTYAAVERVTKLLS